METHEKPYLRDGLAIARLPMNTEVLDMVTEGLQREYRGVSPFRATRFDEGNPPAIQIVSADEIIDKDWSHRETGEEALLEDIGNPLFYRVPEFSSERTVRLIGRSVIANKSETHIVISPDLGSTRNLMSERHNALTNLELLAKVKKPYIWHPGNFNIIVARGNQHASDLATSRIVGFLNTLLEGQVLRLTPSIATPRIFPERS
ncbi:MAG: hypothetical protein JWL85_900 [Candidatus Saccharibacteria bacterium]|nr:hypothetical protein [Candidatus Saccharibacteria bacterium]